METKMATQDQHDSTRSREGAKPQAPSKTERVTKGDAEPAEGSTALERVNWARDHCEGSYQFMVGKFAQSMLGGSGKARRG